MHAHARVFIDIIFTPAVAGASLLKAFVDIDLTISTFVSTVAVAHVRVYAVLALADARACQPFAFIDVRFAVDCLVLLFSCY